MAHLTFHVQTTNVIDGLDCTTCRTPTGWAMIVIINNRLLLVRWGCDTHDIDIDSDEHDDHEDPDPTD